MQREKEAEEFGKGSQVSSLLTLLLPKRKKTLQQSKKPSARILREVRIIERDANPGGGSLSIEFPLGLMGKNPFLRLGGETKGLCR